MNEQGVELTVDVLRDALDLMRKDLERDPRVPIPQRWYDAVVRIEGKQFAEAHFLPFTSHLISPER